MKLHYYKKRPKEEKAFKHKMDLFVRRENEVGLLSWGEGGTGKTALISWVLLWQLSAELKIDIVYWKNVTNFNKQQFYNEFADQIEISQNLPALSRFKKAQKKFRGVVLIVFDDVYGYNVDKVLETFEDFEPHTRALCLARTEFNKEGLIKLDVLINRTLSICCSITLAISILTKQSLRKWPSWWGK